MDEIMKALGANVLQWGFKTECCGGGLTACRPNVGLDMTQKILCWLLMKMTVQKII